MAGIPRLATAIVAALLLGVSYRSGGLTALLVVVVGVLIGVLYAWLYIKTVKVTITETDIIYKKLLRTIHINRANFTGVLVNYLVSSGPPRPVNMLIMQDSASLDSIRLNGAFWDESIDVIAKKVHAKNLLDKGTMTDRAFAAQYPALRSWSQRHPVIFVWLIVCITLAVIALIAIAVFMTLGPSSPGYYSRLK
ncbi:MAG: hypothetical protein JWM52_273 [Candidatus Saccharibacteria bacterium]|nr:hypothetical protein [Candidatus Saccharibacteria bacterium]